MEAFLAPRDGDGADARRPELPPGRFVDLPKRGTTFVRELPGPAGAPTVILLHGWTVTADLNWYPTYQPLSEHFRVIALDHRGHGRGIRTRRPFRLEDCADDAMALADVLEVERPIVVGYSMGGIIAQLMWRRHGARLGGLVLCATAGSFTAGRQDQLNFVGLGGLALFSRFSPPALRARLVDQYLDRRTKGWQEWADEELRTSDWTMVLEAGAAIGWFSSQSWAAEIDVPTAVVVTTDDRVIPTARQRSLAQSIPGAHVYEIEGDHDVCVSAIDRFVPLLITATRAVAYPT
ncbi:MAG: putative hydrolase [Acidimicrobiia bacterium]|nr:putative hydrolase [Acidimicrobiia bacterium]